MSSRSTESKKPAAQTSGMARDTRLKAALKANLARRKRQSRARKDVATKED